MLYTNSVPNCTVFIRKKKGDVRTSPKMTQVTSPSVRGWSDQGHAIVSIALSPQAVLERWAHRHSY